MWLSDIKDIYVQLWNIIASLSQDVFGWDNRKYLLRTFLLVILFVFIQVYEWINIEFYDKTERWGWPTCSLYWQIATVCSCNKPYAVATVCSCNKQYVVATNIMLLQQTVCSCSGMQFPHYDVTTSWSCNVMQLQLQHYVATT